MTSRLMNGNSGDLDRLLSPENVIHYLYLRLIVAWLGTSFSPLIEYVGKIIDSYVPQLTHDGMASSLALYDPGYCGIKSVSSTQSF